MQFQVSALDAGQFRDLYELDEHELARRGVIPCMVDEKPGFPCRVSLLDADIGETVFLLNYEHQPAATPYRSSHAIFVRKGAETATPARNEVPAMLRGRTLSVRAFDGDGMMVDAGVIHGENLEELIERFFADESVRCLHVHNASRGCFAAMVNRA